MESLVQGKLACRVRRGGCGNVRSERNATRRVLTQFFEVQVTLVSGDYTGLVFRTNSDPTNGASYQFSIDTSGQYYLKLYDSGHSTGLALRQGSTTPIVLGQSYLFAVVADYSNIGLYVNQQKIDSVADGSLSHGQIGVFVGNINNSALAVFSHARVWTL